MEGYRELDRYHRRLPHWRFEGSTYFITFKTLSRNLAVEEIKQVLQHVLNGDGRFYTLVAASVMPDHVHVLLRPDFGFDLSRVTKGMKGASARLLNKARGDAGSVWQDESWDRIVRNQDELDEKLTYMLTNPVEAGLIADPWEWPGWFVNRGV